MIWGRSHLIEACEKDGLIDPFDPSRVGQASIDLTVSKFYRKPHPVWSLHDYSGLTVPKLEATPQMDPDLYEIPKGGLIVLPGDFLLLSTREKIRIPPDAAAFILCRSGFARKGGNHSNAGFGDPGFGWNELEPTGISTYTLEVYTVSPIPLALREGDSIVQLIVMSVDERVARHYGHTGSYQGQVLPTPAANGRQVL